MKTRKSIGVILALILCMLISGCSENYGINENEGLSNESVVSNDELAQELLQDSGAEDAGLSSIGEYSGSPYIYLNGNIPYVNTKKFHLPTCSSVDSMSEKNKKLYEGTIYEIKQKGYTPCARRLEMYR